MNAKLYMAATNNLNKEIDTQYIRFYKNLDTFEIFIFLIETEWINRNNILEQVVKKVIDPITNTIVHQFDNIRYLTPISNDDDYANLDFSSDYGDYIMIEQSEIQLPEKINIKDIHKLYTYLNNIKTPKIKKR